MRLRAVVGAVLCGLVLTGCTGSGTPAPDRVASGAEVAGLDGWRLPAGAPEFCTALADAEHVDKIPEAVGLLMADPADPYQAWRLTQSTGDLREARDAVRREGAHAELAAALDELVDALVVASSGPLDQEATERIADGLADVGRQAQPPCEFPT
jgi:hypothetical protein